LIVGHLYWCPDFVLPWHGMIWIRGAGSTEIREEISDDGSMLMSVFQLWARVVRGTVGESWTALRSDIYISNSNNDAYLPDLVTHTHLSHAAR